MEAKCLIKKTLKMVVTQCGPTSTVYRRIASSDLKTEFHKSLGRVRSTPLSIDTQQLTTLLTIETSSCKDLSKDSCIREFVNSKFDR
jgi:hypothetical protein